MQGTEYNPSGSKGMKLLWNLCIFIFKKVPKTVSYFDFMYFFNLER